jgi:hypothetical protein
MFIGKDYTGPAPGNFNRRTQTKVCPLPEAFDRTYYRKHSRVERVKIPQPGTGARLKFWRANLVKLKQMVRALRPEQHDQGSFTNTATVTHPCGTQLCILGWAAVSGWFKGLQWSYDPSSPKAFTYYPVINGNAETWPDAGRKFFGIDTYWDLFSKGEVGDKSHVLRIIDKCIKRLDKRLERGDLGRD